MTRRVVVRTLAFHAAGPGSIPGLRHHLFRCLAALRVYFSRLYYKASENIDISTVYYKARENINISTAYVIRVQKIKKIFLLPFSTKHPLANGIIDKMLRIVKPVNYGGKFEINVAGAHLHRSSLFSSLLSLAPLMK